MAGVVKAKGDIGSQRRRQSQVIDIVRYGKITDIQITITPGNKNLEISEPGGEGSERILYAWITLTGRAEIPGRIGLRNKKR
jgi:hypothetical protein